MPSVQDLGGGVFARRAIPSKKVLDLTVWLTPNTKYHIGENYGFTYDGLYFWAIRTGSKLLQSSKDLVTWNTVLDLDNYASNVTYNHDTNQLIVGESDSVGRIYDFSEDRKAVTPVGTIDITTPGFGVPRFSYFPTTYPGSSGLLSCRGQGYMYKPPSATRYDLFWTDYAENFFYNKDTDTLYLLASKNSSPKRPWLFVLDPNNITNVLSQTQMSGATPQGLYGTFQGSNFIYVTNSTVYVCNGVNPYTGPA